MKSYFASGWKLLLPLGIVALGLAIDVGSTGIAVGPPDAHAVVGRPATPRSYAGVARRTVRTPAIGLGAPVARAAVRLTALPMGCVAAGGVYRCGTVNYRAVYDGPDVVYVVIE